MAITSYSSASPTVGTTEYSFAAASTTLPTRTDSGVYALVVDTNAMAAGDSFVVKLYEAGVAAGTKRLAEEWYIEGVQGKPIAAFRISDLVLGNGWDLTVTKVAGTDRALPFTLWRVS